MNQIKITFYFLKIPLTQPYDLSFTSLDHFKTIICLLEGKSKFGIGEVTALEGYSEESIENIWSFQKDICNKLDAQKHADIPQIKRNLKKKGKTNPFSITPLYTAIETFQNQDILKGNSEIPLVGLIPLEEKKKIADILQKKQESGYKTFKAKVGKNLSKDLPLTNFLLSQLPDDAKLRIDVNQGYDFNKASKFLSEIKFPERMELFEQPLPKDQWKEARKLNSQFDIPIMLDEAIYNKEDIQKTAKMNCAELIKLKLCKFGSLDRIMGAIELAKKLDLKVILGNGVQSELGCLLEGYIYSKADLYPLAGEMNGFQKQDYSLTSNLLLKKNRVKISFDLALTELKKQLNNHYNEKISFQSSN